MAKRKKIFIDNSGVPDIAIVKLGQLVEFMPASFYHEATDTPTRGKPLYQKVTGRIWYINWRHRYFTVAYEINGMKFNESFKF